MSGIQGTVEGDLHVPVTDRSLAGVAEKILSGGRIDDADARSILGSRDIHLIGAMAEHRKQRSSGRFVYFTLNKQINYTNVCSVRCKVCAYAKGKRAKGAYTMSVEDIIDELSEYRDGLDEVHIVGGLHQDIRFDYYTSMLRGIRTRFPDVTIKAFTATEIGYFAGLYRMSVEEVLRRLVDAGRRGGGPV